MDGILKMREREREGKRERIKAIRRERRK